MQLRPYTLTAEEVEKLDSVHDEIGKTPELREFTNTIFKAFLIKIGTKLERQDRRRALQKPSVVRYRLTVLVYDFTVNDLQQGLRHAFPSQARVGRLIDDLIAMRQEIARKSENIAMHIESTLEASAVAEDVPASFYKEYFGYRRSSTEGGVIRFYLEIIRQPNNKMVGFVNEYFRRVRWKVDGFGVYVKETLYLYGHARRATPPGDSLGLRFFALRPSEEWPDILTGPLISMNFDEPIAARAVLVPATKHNFSGDERKLSEQKKLVEYLIHRDPETYDVEKQILGHLKGVFGRRPPEYLFHMIRNGTFSVLSGTPPPSEALTDAEIELIKLCRTNEWTTEDLCARGIRTILDGPQH
ncbi:MAG: hypothetical protein WDO17_04460 [Alphaproteobacteria bacterium]